MHGDKEFNSQLKQIAPDLLISSEPNEIDSFFLVLALIYNDLKGLLVFGEIWTELYRKVEPDEFSAHAGEVGGLTVQRYKLMASLVNELLIFLRRNESALSNPSLQALFLKMHKTYQKKWLDLVNLATSNDDPNSSFAKNIARIRSNIGFHYDHSKTQLKKAYSDFFLNSPKIPANEWAFYSLGRNMENSRFYYADAAAMQYVGLGENSPTEDAEKMSEIISDINAVLWSLIGLYLDSKSPKA